MQLRVSFADILRGENKENVGWVCGTSFRWLAYTFISEHVPLAETHECRSATAWILVGMFALEL